MQFKGNQRFRGKRTGESPQMFLCILHFENVRSDLPFIFNFNDLYNANRNRKTRLCVYKRAS